MTTNDADRYRMGLPLAHSQYDHHPSHVPVVPLTCTNPTRSTRMSTPSSCGWFMGSDRFSAVYTEVGDER